MKSAIAFTLLLLTTPMAMAQACQDGPASTETPRFASPVEGDIVSGFGERRHPILGTNKFHTGVDYAMEFGSPVRAAAAGRVLATGTNEGYGIYIILAHARGYETTYAQLSAIAAALLIRSANLRNAVQGNSGFASMLPVDRLQAFVA